jgi:hypothetical protein
MCGGAKFQAIARVEVKLYWWSDKKKRMDFQPRLLELLMVIGASTGAGGGAMGHHLAPESWLDKYKVLQRRVLAH